MARRSTVLIGLVLLAGCGGTEQIETTGETVPSTTTSTTTTVPEPTTTTSTTPAPEPEPAPEPILCPGAAHPAHHRPCQAPRATTAAPSTPRATTAAPAPTQARGAGACGGDLPPCSVMQRESGGDPTAVGYGQCGTKATPRDCQGKWQIDPNTAESVGYPRNLAEQPEHVQDDAARAIKARDGCGAWSTC